MKIAELVIIVRYEINSNSSNNFARDYIFLLFVFICVKTQTKYLTIIQVKAYEYYKLQRLIYFTLKLAKLFKTTP